MERRPPVPLGGMNHCLELPGAGLRRSGNMSWIRRKGRGAYKKSRFIKHIGTELTFSEKGL